MASQKYNLELLILKKIELFEINFMYTYIVQDI